MTGWYWLSCVGLCSAPGEQSRAQSAGVNGIGRNVERPLAVILLHQLAQCVHGRRIAGHPAGEGELVTDAPRARQQRHRTQDDGAMQPRQYVLAPLAEGEAFAQLRTGKDRTRAVDLHPALALLGKRSQLMQPQVHFICDVAQVTPASGSAAIVHLEAYN